MQRGGQRVGEVIAQIGWRALGNQVVQQRVCRVAQELLHTGAFGVIAFITALRRPASAMFPMLLTTSGGTVSALRRGAPGAAVSFIEKRRSSSTCVHSAYEETSQASAPATVRTLRTGSRVRNSATSSGIRSPRAENGTSRRTVAVIWRGSVRGDNGVALIARCS